MMQSVLSTRGCGYDDRLYVLQLYSMATVVFAVVQ
jgi:hypothetical protein